MKKIFYLMSIALLFSVSINAQENQDENTQEEVVQKTPAKPVRNPWNSGFLMGGKTSVIPGQGAMRFELAHHFGPMNNGLSDMFGVYAAAANVRMGLSYVPFKNFQFGAALTRNNMTTDINAKWTVFEQTRKDEMPISITLEGNMGINGNDKDAYGKDYAFTDRFSYYGQLIVGRMFNEFISFQVAAQFAHANFTAINMNHDQLAAGVGAKIRITPSTFFILNADIPVHVNGIDSYRENGQERVGHSKPNIQGGVEFTTSTHVFQIYISTASQILSQNVLLYNQNQFNKDGIRFGFIMTKI